MGQELQFTPEMNRKLSGGRKVIIAGNNHRERRQFAKCLARIGSSPASEFTVQEGLEKAGGEDYVFLFAEPEDTETLQGLLGQLRELTVIKPAAAVLVSDYRVYGKLFGTLHPLKEHELGYVCHTRMEDGLAFGLRMAEHTAYRLAEEEGVQIQIVRLPADLAADRMERAAGAALQVLLQGRPGEVYNLPVENGEGFKETSPLSPNPLWLDTEKFRQEFGRENGRKLY